VDSDSSSGQRHPAFEQLEPDEQFTAAYNKICHKAEQDLLQLLIHQQQKNSSTDAETIPVSNNS